MNRRPSRAVDGLRTGFDASVLDGDYMPEPVGTGAMSAEVPLLLVYCKDEYGAMGMFPGLRPKDVRDRGDAVERLTRLLPVRGTLALAAAEDIAGAYFDAYAADVLPSGAPARDFYVQAASDIWQYHAVMTIAETHANAMGGPGRTFVAEYTYGCAPGGAQGGAQGGANAATPHAADLAATFGILPPIPFHGKGADFDGIVEVVQGAYGAFARSGDPSTPETAAAKRTTKKNSENAAFVAFDPKAPKLTTVDSPAAGGCQAMEAKAARDTAYRALVAAVRAAEK